MISMGDHERQAYARGATGGVRRWKKTERRQRCRPLLTPASNDKREAETTTQELDRDPSLDCLQEYTNDASESWKKGRPPSPCSNHSPNLPFQADKWRTRRRHENRGQNPADCFRGAEQALPVEKSDAAIKGIREAVAQNSLRDHRRSVRQEQENEKLEDRQGLHLHIVRRCTISVTVTNRQRESSRCRSLTRMSIWGSRV